MNERERFEENCERPPVGDVPGALLAAFRELQWQGWQANSLDWLHHALAKHGWHPGRTDDSLADLVEQALAAGPAGPYPNKRVTL